MKATKSFWKEVKDSKIDTSKEQDILDRLLGPVPKEDQFFLEAHSKPKESKSEAKNFAAGVARLKANRDLFDRPIPMKLTPTYIYNNLPVRSTQLDRYRNLNAMKNKTCTDLKLSNGKLIRFEGNELVPGIQIFEVVADGLDSLPNGAHVIGNKKIFVKQSKVCEPTRD
jgi:hypothetical protein